jgi:glycosyltransferase involved in cell wall biosynthesis
VIVVDDGSTDGTADAVMSAAVQLPVRVVSQANSGRHAARMRGLQEAAGELVMFLDSRVSILPGSFAFLAERLTRDPSDDVWNAHVVIATDGNPYGRFWNVLTELAFATYFANPRTTRFDAENFDLFPKGTTCFVAPRSVVAAAYGRHASYYADSRFANDDTPMIRAIAERHPISISPHFACLYRPRDALTSFMRHAFHRGIVFLDGHGRRGARMLPLVIGFYPSSAAIAVLTIKRPWVAPVALGAVSAGAGAFASLKRRPPSETIAFAALSPVYGLAHGLGMWRGAALALSTRLRRT